MSDRKKQVEELMEGFMSLRHRGMQRKHAVKKGRPITQTQWGVVMYIRNHSSCTVKDIAETFAISSSAATQLVNGLVKKGYVMRKQHAADRRSVDLTLSKSASEHMISMKEKIASEFMEVFKALTDKEFDLYCALNRKIVQAAGRGSVHTK